MKTLRNEVASCVVSVCLALLRKKAVCFPKCLYRFAFHPQYMKILVTPHFQQHLVLSDFYFLNLPIPSECGVIYCGFHLNFRNH